MATIIPDSFQYYLILAQLCFLPFLCSFIFFKKRTNGVNLPPTVGHLHYLLIFLARKPSFSLFNFPTHKFLHALSSKYGPLLHLRGLYIPVILVSSASVAYEIFTVHDVNVSSRNFPSITNEVSDNILDTSGFFTAPYGEYFNFMKKLVVSKMLGPNGHVQWRSIRVDELERFHENMLDKARKKESVEIIKQVRELVGNIVGRMTVGKGFTEPNGEIGSIQDLVTKEPVTKMTTVLGNFIFELLAKLGIQRFKNRTVLKKIDKLLERFLLEHKEKPNRDQCLDMMDVLLAVYEDKNAEYKITRSNIKMFFLEIFHGGIETSVNSIQWTMAEIINNPIIADRLREEIDSVVGKSRLIQETDLPNLPYLQAVIKETLRLHPPVSLIREFKQECTVGGFFVPEKAKLVVNLYAVMRDPNFWEDPLEFKPERFLTSSSSGQQEEKKKQAMKYLPFGGGRRGCPASNLGYTIVGTTIGMMVQCFEWRIKGKNVSMDECSKDFHKTMAHPLTLTLATRIDLETSPNLQTE